MWPAAASLVYYLGIGGQAVLGVLLAPRLRVRPAVVAAIVACYLVGMTVGARVLFELRQGSFVPAGVVRHECGLRGMWGGPLVYLALAVPLVLVLTKRGRNSPELKVLSPERGEARFSIAGSQLPDGAGKKRGSGGRAGIADCRSKSATRDGAGWTQRRAAQDLIALAAPIPMAIAKLACLCAGCCHGKPTSLPWAITFPATSTAAPGGVPLHPTQVYDMLVLLATAAVLAWLNRPRWRGTILLWFIALYGLGRLLTEFTRGDLAQRAVYSWGPLTSFQWLCAAAACVCIAALIVYNHRTRARL